MIQLFTVSAIYNQCSGRSILPLFTFVFLWRYLGILGYYTLVFLCKYLVLSLLGECSILWSCFLNMGLAICSSYENYLAKSNSVGTLESLRTTG